MKDLSVIITLYKTPHYLLKNLKNYKGLKLYILNQNKDENLKKKLNNIFGKQLNYFEFDKNKGLSVSSNFLLNQVSTKFCIFTQADIVISKQTIKKVYDFVKRNDYVFVGPTIISNVSEKKKKKNFFELVKKLDASIMFLNVKKVKKIGFFDEDFFLYWEDVMLMKKINQNGLKMAKLNNLFAIHKGESSSINSYQIKYLRWLNYRYGEYLYDYKNKNFRELKIFRRLIVNKFILFMGIVSFDKQVVVRSLAEIISIIKIYFYLFNNLLKININKEK